MAKNDDFDFEKFSVNTIRFIDSIRSYELAGARPTESRINAFYRAVGLPAIIRKDPNESEKDGGETRTPSIEVPDPVNNGNIFDPNDLDYNTYATEFNLRKIQFTSAVTDDEVNNFLDIHDKKFSNSLGPKRGRTRGLLLPPVVDGEIHIFPQKRRIGGAFMTNDERTYTNTTYARPLLETILSIRLKGENVVDSQKQNSLATSLGSQSLEKLNADALKRLTLTLNNISENIENVVNRSGEIRRKSNITIVPDTAFVAQQNPSIRLPKEENRGELDKRKDKIDVRIAIKQTISALFEFDDILTGSKSRSMVDSALTSQVLEILTPRDTVSNKSVISTAEKKTKEEIKKVTADVKALAKSIDLLYGEFAGISGIDILVVIVSLFRISTNDLVGLLNKDSQNRLEKLKGTSVTSSASSVSTALINLENMIQTVLLEVDSSVSAWKHREKLRNKARPKVKENTQGTPAKDK